ncbi:MAG TPA: hypothetical protein VG102_02680 [Candidatus Paceibacterota bacterium]|jgi:hypothetical protein|nr:hypothetical protein [Candidatus Paceibacterota bacterium]
MPVTYFIAAVIGFYLIIAGVLFVVRRKAFTDSIGEMSRSPEFLILAGFIASLIGLLIVLSNNIWNGDHIELLITILGWIVLLKGLALLFVPQRTIEAFTGWCNLYKLFWLYAIICVVIGLYLVHGGLTQGAGLMMG